MAKPRHRWSKIERRNLAYGLLFISPWLTGFLALTAYPIFRSLAYSFTQYSGVGSPKFVGFQNYAIIFSRDPFFWLSIRNTLFLAVVGLPLNIIVGVTAAVILNQNLRGQRVFRTIFFLPSIMPAVGTTLIFLWVLNPEFGLVNDILRWFGIVGPGWFSSPGWSKPAIVLLNLWGVGGGMVIYLANLKNIPQYLYEAAAIDGANGVRKFIHVTLPMLTPAIFFNLIMGTISTFSYFTQSYVASSGSAGGPLNSMMMYAMYLFEQAFSYFNMGYASALAWILFVMVLLITILLFLTSWRWVFYASES